MSSHSTKLNYEEQSHYKVQGRAVITKTDTIWRLLSLVIYVCVEPYKKAVQSKGQLSEPDHRGRRWLQCGEVEDECKIQLSALEVKKYRKWCDAEMTRRKSDSQPETRDPVSEFFQSLHSDSDRRVCAGKSLFGCKHALAQQTAEAKSLQESRRRSFEEKVILDGTPRKLPLGQLGNPDSFGWRWYQCEEDVQILLPPDAAVQYSAFLITEENELRRATCRSHVHRFDDARARFNASCMKSKLVHPVRGITSSAGRFALPLGFRCRSVDKMVGRPQDKVEYALLGGVHSMSSTAGTLSPTDQYWRRWLRMDNDTWVLLPADVASQYDIMCKFSRSKSLTRRVHKIFQELREMLIPVDAASPDYAGRLYLLRHDACSTTLDKVVTRIELRLAEMARQHARNVSPLPGWRNDIFESIKSDDKKDASAGSLNRHGNALKDQIDVDRNAHHTSSSRARRKTMPGRRRYYWDKDLPPLPMPMASALDFLHCDECRKCGLERRNSVPEGGSPIERIRRTFTRSVTMSTTSTN